MGLISLTRRITYTTAEHAKISVRNARHEELKGIKAQKEEGEISEDMQKDLEAEVQEKVNQANQEIDQLTKNKETEVKTV